MADFEASAATPSFMSAAPAPRMRRPAFHPSLSPVRSDPGDFGDSLGDGFFGADTYASPAGGAEAASAAHSRQPPVISIGQAMGVNPAGPKYTTQALGSVRRASFWKPTAWRYGIPRYEPPIDIDLEMQSLTQANRGPRAPKAICSPGSAELKNPPEALKTACYNSQVFIKLIGSQMLEQLSDKDFKTLMHALAGSEHTCHWHYSVFQSFERCRAPWIWLLPSKLSGTSALFLQLMEQGATQLAERVMCAEPVEIALELSELTPNLITLHVLTSVFGGLVPRVTQPQDDAYPNRNKEMKALARLVTAFTSEHVRPDAKALEACTIQLMQHLENSGFETNGTNVGLMAGAILTGNLHYGATVLARSSGIKYASWVAVLAIFAGLGFVETNKVSGVVGVVSFVIALCFERLWVVRNLKRDINEIEGDLRTKITTVKMFKKAYDAVELIIWIGNVRKANGLDL